MKNITGFRYKKLVAIRPTDKRKNGCIVWECQCDCGNIIFTPASSLTCGRKGSCGCLEKENQQTIGKRVDNKKDITGQKFGRLTAISPTNKRVGTNVVWNCKCECGNEKEVHIGALGKTVFSCGCLRKDMAREKGLLSINNLIGNTYGKLTVIDYVNIDDKKGSYWKCKCSCGNETIVSARNLIHGHTMSCGCMTESHGEFTIKTLLDNANITYKKEYKVDVGFISNYPARFDFIVYLDKTNYYFIEYDGEQHFKNTGYGDVKETQKRDKEKNKWCLENNIPLIRIPYWHLNTLCLQDLLLDTSSFLIDKVETNSEVE